MSSSTTPTPPSPSTATPSGSPCATRSRTRDSAGSRAARPEIQVVLSQPHAGRSQEDGDALAALLAKGELRTIQFRSDDLDATFEKVAGAPGAEVLQEPASQP